MGAEIMTDEWDHLPGDGEMAWLGAVICGLSAGCSGWIWYRVIRFVLDAVL